MRKLTLILEEMTSDYKIRRSTFRIASPEHLRNIGSIIEKKPLMGKSSELMIHANSIEIVETVKDRGAEEVFYEQRELVTA